MATILLLLPTTSYKARDFLRAAERLGIDVVVGTDRRQALEDETSGTALSFDPTRPDEAVETIRRLHRDRPLAAILGVDDETVVLANRAAGEVGLPHDPPDAVADATNKVRFRQRMRRAGLPVPGFTVHRRADDPASIEAEVPYPCVVKPTFLSASRGVVRADDRPQLVDALDRIGAILDLPEVRRRGGGDADLVLVEQYVPGDELALEALLTGARLLPLRLFDKPDPLEGPTFEETLYVAPARVSEEVREASLDAVQDATEALGLREGPVHAEIRLPPDEPPVVLELAPRTIGGLCGRAVRFGGGLSLEEVVLRHALGEVEMPPPEPAATGVMMIPIPGRGVLERVEGVEAAASVSGIREVEISINPGQELVPLPEGNRYLGFLFAEGASPDRVERALREAHDRLDVRIRRER